MCVIRCNVRSHRKFKALYFIMIPRQVVGIYVSVQRKNLSISLSLSLSPPLSCLLSRFLRALSLRLYLGLYGKHGSGTYAFAPDLSFGHIMGAMTNLVYAYAGLRMLKSASEEEVFLKRGLFRKVHFFRDC